MTLVQCEMGSASPGAALVTVTDAVRDLDPNAVVMVGIAFGVDSSSSRIGDILVSKQLCLYEPQRVGTGQSGAPQVTPRGDRVTASTVLLGRLRAATASWTGSPVRFGLLLSGEKLVDQVEGRDAILADYPEALGGEMEAAGLYAACAEADVDWVVVKAICDWADGKKQLNKEQRQKTAADNAARFVLHAIAQGGFAP